MNRNDFLTKGSPHIFMPSVGEVWRHRSDGSEILLYSKYEPDGFHGVGYNSDFTLNFNHLPEYWMEQNEYVKTLTDLEVNEVISQKKASGWL